MVIVHLVAPAQVGGLERVVHSLAIGQQRWGHRVTVAAILEAESDAAHFFQPFHRVGVPVQRIIAPGRSYRAERDAVRSLVRQLAPDVVHSHGYRPDVIDGGLIRRLGVATVTTAHGYTGGSWRNRLYESIQRRAFRRFDAVIAVSQPLGDLLVRSGVPKDRLYVVPNAFIQIAEPLDRVAARAMLGLSGEDFVIGWVGRMIGEKGLDVMIAALPAVSDLRFRLCAIGDGPDRAIQEARAQQLGLANRITWAGLVPEAGKLFAAFDAYVISSRTEGLPISLFEAMALRVPVVTTRVGGIPQAISSEHALMVEPEQPEQLGAAVRTVMEDGAGAAARAQRAEQRLFSNFGADTWLTRHDEVYQAAIQRRSRS